MAQSMDGGEPADERRWSLTALAPAPVSVAEARRATRTVLAAWGVDDFEWVLSQLVTEVATNAVLHAGTPFDITLRYDGERLRCEVHDGSPRPPRVRNYAQDATTGRGMHLLGEMSAAWGVERAPAGKIVWFELVAGQDGGMFDLDGLLHEAGLDGAAPGREQADPSPVPRAQARQRASRALGTVRAAA